MKISFEGVCKEYHTPNLIKALDNVSWSAQSGEVFGILGPNGAGKSTMLKVFLGIVRPNVGRVLVNDKPLSELTAKLRSVVGYMPEERGLYQDETVLRQLVYLGMLKGLTHKESKKRSLDLLERFELSDWTNAKIAALSKGMSFKVQLIACLVHAPQVVILDEPFYGLDPVNIRLVRSVICELRSSGSLVLLSTHMMNEVEKLCDKIVMMYRGRIVVEGAVSEIQRKYGGDCIIVNKEACLEEIPFVVGIDNTDHEKRIKLREGKTLYDLMRAIVDNQINITMLQEALMPLEDVFVDIVKRNGEVDVKNSSAL